MKFEQVNAWAKKCIETDIKLPKRSDSGSAGYDFYSNEDFCLAPGAFHLFWTDVKAEIDSDKVLMIFPRSGMGVKNGIILRNGTGIIDSSYYNNMSNDGNIGICLLNTSDNSFNICSGDKIAQGVFVNFYIINDDMSNSGRSGGFGSSGK